MSIATALAIWTSPATKSTADVLRQHPGPYRAMSAYKGDEEKGERDFPWIVVGASNVNVFGRLWPKSIAMAAADELNSEATP